jgi:8-oxo-dGTP pyrophosphatase MutT (NUDIX family)
MADWQTRSSEVVYETPWIKVRRDEVLNQHGQPLTYSYMELQNPSVFTVPVNAKGEILLQSTYRYTVRMRTWEIPAGHMETGEEPLKAAKRELHEETGLQSDDWVHLGRFYQILGTGNAPVEAFLARDVQSNDKATDDDEDIKDRHFVTLTEVEQMIQTGELVDGPVITTIYMAKLHGITKEKK